MNQRELIMFRSIVEEMKTSKNHVYLKCNESEHHFWGHIVSDQCWSNLK